MPAQRFFPYSPNVEMKYRLVASFYSVVLPAASWRDGRRGDLWPQIGPMVEQIWPGI